MQINIFLSVISIIFVILAIKKHVNAVLLGFFLILALPIGSTNIIMDLIDVITIKGIGINLIHIVTLTIFLTSLKDIYFKMKSHKKFSICSFILLLFIFISTLIGYINNQNVIQDGQKFVIFFIWIVLGYTYLKNFGNYKNFMKITILAIMLNFSFNIIFNIMMPHTNFLLIENIEILSEENGFVSYAANISLITLSFSLYTILNYNLNKKELIFHILNIAIILINNFLFSGNRTFLILSFLEVIIILSTSNFYRKKIKPKKTLLLGSFALVLTIIILVVFFNDTIHRKFLNAFTNGGIDANLVTRINTILYYSKKIFIMPLGYGFGKELPLINKYWRFHGNSLYTDNAFINIGMKMGIFALLLTFVCVIYLVYRILKYTKKNSKIIIIISFFSFVISSAIMTGQILNTYPITVFFAVYFLVIYTETQDVEIKGSD